MRTHPEIEGGGERFNYETILLTGNSKAVASCNVYKKSTSQKHPPYSRKEREAFDKNYNMWLSQCFMIEFSEKWPIHIHISL